MGQIAALPYRFGGPGMDGPTEILLITSRGTGRWVIPKGNPLTGMPLPASAAVGAEEEAGVIGAVCPTPLGSYQYSKRRANGASVLLALEVFPIAVTRELGEWRDTEESDRRWFPISNAHCAGDAANHPPPNP